MSDALLPICATEDDQRWLLGLSRRPPESSGVSALRELVIGGLRRALAGRWGVSDADIEDFAQQTVIRVLDRLETFEGRSRLSTWVLAIAIRIALSDLRRRRWAGRSLADLALDPSGRAAPARPPAGDAEQEEDAGRLRRAIEADLTPRQRAAILAELAGMPTRVLAEQLGISTNALYKLTHDARRKLRSVLACGTDGPHFGEQGMKS